MNAKFCPIIFFNGEWFEHIGQKEPLEITETNE